VNDALLLLPDFLLIALGFALCRFTALDRPIWEGAERLVYYLLFPVLLFTSIIRNPIDVGASSGFAACGVAISACGIACAYALRRVPGVDPLLFASGAQAAFRFNSYIALAVAERLAGSQGVAWAALLIALCVPICNFAAVWPLARQGGQHFGGEVVRNPLIIATVAGLAANLAGLGLPDFAAVTLGRIGGAALPLGLMAVGAGLQVGALREGPGLAAALLAIRHIVQPAVAFALALRLALPLPQQKVLVVFAALPTSASSYVLAARMGGRAGFVAGLVTASTLVAMVGLPLALAVLAALG
jgi:malonate transporter and related proteins